MPPKLTRRNFLARLGSGAITIVGIAGTGLFAALGDVDDAAACVRPPGALPEEDFLATCIRCGRCTDACPNRCITPFTEEAGRELALAPGARQFGTPVIFARRQACMLCNGEPGDGLLCTEACPTGALIPTKKSAVAVQESVDMGTAVVDTTICYSYNGASCGACIRACPFEGTALRAGLWERPIVDPEVCIGCGLCERSCVHYPQAIRIKPSTDRDPTTRGRS